LAYDDAELLKIVGEERKRSLGFGEGDSGELTERRQTGLAYARGDMVKDVAPKHRVPAPEGRSGVTDSTVADSIETLLPDVLEVFVGGDDIATFIPQGEQDEQAAQDETDYVHHVIFVENEGYLVLQSAIKDALQAITGIVHWWSEEEEAEEPVGPPMQPEEAQQAQAVAKAPPDGSPGADLESEEQDDGTVQLKRTTRRLKVCIKAVPCEDFTVASDTVSLREANYCAMRSRVRVQDLIADGIDAEKARALPSYSRHNETVEQARDEAGEHNTPQDGGSGDLRIVEVRAHYVKLLDDDGDLSLHRVLTDSEETVLLESDEADHIPFGGGSPYLIPHRFYGEGVPDKTIEVQKVKTVALRSHMDGIYFALNQRIEVSEADASENTIADLMRNAPGMPVRSKTGNALKPLQAGPLDVDMLATLEYAATMAEGRTGIVRNAQGLNPDTLHDTAQGALALIGAAQKRIRLIARNFAETMVKDLFLGVHRTLRVGYTDDHQPASAKLRNQWRTIKPQTWPSRDAMEVHVGIGSAGREHDLAIAGKRLEMTAQVAAEGGMGTVLDPKNIYNQLLAFERAAGTKGAERYWTDPATAPPQPPQQDPKMAEVQGKLQIQQAEAQAKTQQAAQSAQADLSLQQAKHQAQMQQDAEAGAQKLQLQREQMQLEAQMKAQQAAAELQLRREIAAEELQLKRELALLQAHQTHEHNMAKVKASVQQVQVGGEPG
jgi:hypothetical protein